LHVAPNLPLGEVASRSGPLNAGSGPFEAVISGRGGHGGIPQHAIDPILAASNVIISLQHIVSREADPLDPQVKTYNSSLFEALKALYSYGTSALMCSNLSMKELNHDSYNTHVGNTLSCEILWLFEGKKMLGTITQHYWLTMIFEYDENLGLKPFLT